MKAGAPEFRKGTRTRGPEVAVLDFYLISLFPGFFDSPLRETALARARRGGVVAIHLLNPRDHTEDRHRKADDYPYGGGGGMVLKPEPLVGAILDLRKRALGCRVVLLSPQGERFRQSKAEELAKLNAIGLVCGRYEGVDERVRSFVDAEISVGDFILSGGESAALVVMEAVIRLIPGALGNPDAVKEESFSEGLLEYPQYTRPRSYMGMEVPEVLRSGDHGAIRAWRRQQQLLRTRERRPDLLAGAALTLADREFLDRIRNEKR